jgi:DNA processing protein
VLGASRLLLPEQPDWPRGLCDLADPPERLEVVGSLPDWSQAVAVVGTRKPDARGREFARRLARELAEAGWVVVSGGAAGIDAEAHRGALEAGGPTVAVLGSPLKRPYPQRNIELFQQIIKNGCVLTETLEGAPMYRGRFVSRNRLVAALAKVVVVVQAPLPSGALSTAAVARRLGRPILGVPHAPGDVRGAGCSLLLSQGAGICRGSSDVLSLAAAGSPSSRAKKCSTKSRRPTKDKEFRRLDDDERAVVDALSRGPLAADELCEVSGLPAARAQRALLMLLLSKVIHEVGSGRYARRDYR